MRPGPNRVACLYSPSQSARGGIGRRARLRALWTNSPWWFESTRAHCGKPRFAGLSCFSTLLYSTVLAGLEPRGNNFGNIPLRRRSKAVRAPSDSA